MISESQLIAAQTQVRAEIEPEVARLLERVENHLDRLSRREESLEARAQLLQGRLSQGGHRGMKMPGRTKSSLGVREGTGTNCRASGKGVPSMSAKAGGGGGDPMVEKLRILRQKKERLAYTIERLSLQSQQKQRQLRKSMAAS